MRSSLVSRLAARNLARNVRRTILSVIGVASGCAITVFIMSFERGAQDLRVRAVAESGVGHLAIVPAEWVATRDQDLRLADWREELARARAFEGVEAAAPTASGSVLLAFGTRVVGVEVLGVDPESEQKINRIARAVVRGRYLQDGDDGTTVIGSGVADQLDVDVGDQLYVTVVSSGGDIEYVMLQIVGIISTGSDSIDAAICHVTLQQLSQMTGRDGATEISILLRNPRAIDRTTALLSRQVGKGAAVLTWRDLVPAMGADAAADHVFNNMLMATIVFMVVLGITSARLTAVLERRREFAVLLALGMRTTQIMRLIMLEALAIGAVGSLVGLVVATPLVYLLATKGISFASAFGGDSAVAGVLFDPVIRGDMGPWIVPMSFFVGMASTVIAAVYPTVTTVRTDPTSALMTKEG